MLQVKHGCALAVKAEGDKGEIHGYGSKFGNIDAGYDIVEAGAFEGSLADRGMPKMLWGHDMWEPPIGKWLAAEEDDDGLLLHGKLNLDMQKGAEVYSALKMGTVDGLSIGYMIKDSETDKRGVRHLKEVDLFEVSVVTFPMNEAARVDAVKQTIRGRHHQARARAHPARRRILSTQAKAMVADGYDGLVPRDAIDEDIKLSSIDNVRSILT